jgi:peptidoglycan hydrolase CwlO-like protein
MNTKNEKTIEQIALEEFAWKKSFRNFDCAIKKYAFLIGTLSTILSFIAFVTFTCHDALGLFVFLSLFIGALVGMFGATITLSFRPMYCNDRARNKIIDYLSQEESKKIISDYLQKKITSLQDNIPSCEKKIEKLQSEVDELKKSIEESIQRIPELQEKLSKL